MGGIFFPYKGVSLDATNRDLIIFPATFVLGWRNPRSYKKCVRILCQYWCHNGEREVYILHQNMYVNISKPLVDSICLSYKDSKSLMPFTLSLMSLMGELVQYKPTILWSSHISCVIQIPSLGGWEAYTLYTFVLNKHNGNNAL